VPSVGKVIEQPLVSEAGSNVQPVSGVTLQDSVNPGPSGLLGKPSSVADPETPIGSPTKPVVGT
jgi:hypothetical protein